MRIISNLLLGGLLLTFSLRSQEPPVDPDAKIDPKTQDCAKHIEVIDADDGRGDVRIVWAHGYYSAQRGFDEESNPITWREVHEFALKLEKICRDQPRKLFLVAVKEVE